MGLGATIAIVGFCLARADDFLRERVHVYAAVPAVAPMAPVAPPPVCPPTKRK